MTLSEKVLELLGKKGVTAYEVSMKTGIPHSSLSRILGGESSKLSIKNKGLLSNYFQVDESYFNNGNDLEIKNIQINDQNDFLPISKKPVLADITIHELELLKIELKYTYEKLDTAKEQIKILTDQIEYLKENSSIYNKVLSEKIDFIFMEMKKPVIESKLTLLANLIDEKRKNESKQEENSVDIKLNKEEHQ